MDKAMISHSAKAVRIFDLVEKAQYVLNYCLYDLKGSDEEKVKAAISMVEIYAKAVISDSQCAYSKYASTEKLFSGFLLSPERAEQIAVGITNIFSEFHSEIVSFMGNNPWIVHTVNIDGDKLIVTKTDDFRIMAWTTLRNRIKTIREEIVAQELNGNPEEAATLKILEENLICEWLKL